MRDILVCQESCRYLSNAATPQTESQQDKVNYAVSEREDRVTGVDVKEDDKL